MHCAEKRTVILVPFNENDVEDAFLSSEPPGNFWYGLKSVCAENGYALTTTRSHAPEDVVAIIAFNAPSDPIMEQLTLYPEAKKILFTWEPPCIHSRNFHHWVLEEFDRVVTWNDDLVNGEKFIKFNYALGFSPPEEVIPFHEKKGYCMFVGNKSSFYPTELYSERLGVIEFLESWAPWNFDLYGPDWSFDRICYRGFADNKIAFMKCYKFPIVYENMNGITGYITEKLFDAFSAGCVPIYWGASNIHQFVPQNTFIDREDFGSNEELFVFLESMSEQEYNSYLENIRSFLLSDLARAFSCDQFIATFLDVLKSTLLCKE